MEDRSSTHTSHHCHRPSLHLTLPSLQSPEDGYPSPQPSMDPLQEYGRNRVAESTSSFLTSNTPAVGRRGGNGSDRGVLNTGGGALDGDASLGGHHDGDRGFSSHFVDTWYGTSKKGEIWEDGESCESAADDFYSKSDCYSNTNDVFYNVDCGGEEGIRRKFRANYNNCAHVSETVYNRDANPSHLTKETTSYSHSATGSFSDGSIDYCRTDSRVSDHYLRREEDYGSSCGSGEDQLQPAEGEGPWLSVSPSSQAGDSRWRGTADAHALTSGCQPQKSQIGIGGGTYTQKLDSFSEAFLSQRRRRFPVIPGGDSSGQMWDFVRGAGDSPQSVKLKHIYDFDSDPYLPPSSSPAYPSLPSFPSPPTSSHLMSSVLSPPPTPLPPPSHSPSKMDSPIAFRDAGHSASPVGESLGALQFFPRLQSLPSVHSSGIIWKFPLLSHSFPQPSGDPGSMEGHLRSSHGRDYGNITASHDVHQSPEPFLTSPSDRPSLQLQPPRPSPPNTQSLHSSFHLLPLRSHHLDQRYQESEENIVPHNLNQKVENGLANLDQSQLQQHAYTGTPFPSILHSGRGRKRGHHTPRPLLNPARQGKGLYSSIHIVHHLEVQTAGGAEEDVLPYVNVGHAFQAELPPCLVGGEGSGVWSPEEEPLREQLLWKPLDQLEESVSLQDQVEKLLSMCNSSCVPGGGSNTELALHCLHYCQGNTMATLQMLLFSQPSPTGDYHYSGSDFWTDSEKSLFGEALGTYGKDFPLIQKMVTTKSLNQCVEFYYLSKKLMDKQKKQEEQNRVEEMEQNKSTTPICQPVERRCGLEEAVPVPSLASFFPCKLCGKMFYKIKSRNAHMKIHRQPQEDWVDRRLQHQLLTQRLALSHPTNLVQMPASNLLQPQTMARSFSSSGLPGMSGTSSNTDNVLNPVTNNNAITPSNARVLGPSAVVTYSNIAASHSPVITNIDGLNQRESTAVLPFHQSWGSFGHGAELTTFYSTTEGKGDVGSGAVGAKEPIDWQ